MRFDDEFFDSACVIFSVLAVFFALELIPSSLWLVWSGFSLLSCKVGATDLILLVSSIVLANVAGDLSS